MIDGNTNSKTRISLRTPSVQPSPAWPGRLRTRSPHAPPCARIRPLFRPCRSGLRAAHSCRSCQSSFAASLTLECAYSRSRGRRATRPRAGTGRPRN
jgi:hypothetical protein